MALQETGRERESAPLGALLVTLQDTSAPPEQIREAFHEAERQSFLRSVNQLSAHDYPPRFATLVAAHPNAPLDVLHRAAERAPEGLAANPMLPLLPLEAPEFLSSLSLTARLALLKVEGLPEVVLFALTEDADTHETLATLADALRFYRNSPIGPEAEYENWEDELRERLHHLARVLPINDYPTCRYLVPELLAFDLIPAFVARGGGASALELAVDPLRGWPLHAEDIRAIAEAQDPATSSERLRDLARSSSFAVRLNAVRNPSAPGGARADARAVAMNRVRNRFQEREVEGYLSLVRLAVSLAPVHPSPVYLGARTTKTPLDRLADALTLSLSTRREEIERLAEDADRHVRAVACARLADPRYRFYL